MCVAHVPHGLLSAWEGPQPVWDIIWMSGPALALGQVDGCTWTSDSHAPLYTDHNHLGKSKPSHTETGLTLCQINH